MQMIDLISIIVSSISLIGVLITSLTVAFRFGEFNQRVSNHDREIKDLKTSKVSREAFSSFSITLEEVRQDVKKLTELRSNDPS